MATYKDLQDRIALDYLNRMTLVPEVKRAIQNCIKTYECNRYWFNEGSTAIATTAAQGYAAVPSDFIELDRLNLTYAGQTMPLSRWEDWDIQDANIGLATGVPVAFSYKFDRFNFFPTPDSAYTLNVYYLKTLPTLSADADTNAWTNEAANLIAHAATVDLMSGVLQSDATMIARHVAMMERAQTELDTRNSLRITNRLKPTRF